MANTISIKDKPTMIENSCSVENLFWLLTMCTLKSSVY
jgi:hypothetical protein